MTSAIFDAPGPKARRRIRIITTISLVLFAALLAGGYYLFWSNGQLAVDKWINFSQWPTQAFLLKALGNTIAAALAAAAIALPFGVALALGRLSRRRWIRWPSTVVIELFRAIPLLLVIYIFLIALPQQGINPDLFWKLVIPIALGAGATIAEVVRAGVLSVPSGQAEAGRAIGLTEGRIMRLILLPQAIRLVVPSLVAQLVILLKETTLGYVVSYGELQHSARVLVASTGNLIQTYLIVTLVYIGLNVAISHFASRLDKRTGARRVRRAPAPVTHRTGRRSRERDVIV